MNEFDNYQYLAKQTAIFPADQANAYLGLGLASEAGEVAGKLKKVIRDGKEIDENTLRGELGDVLWYLALLCEFNGLTLAEVADSNIGKLYSRKARGKLGGSGDNR